MLIAIIFSFIIGLLTVNHYGKNWDNPKRTTNKPMPGVSDEDAHKEFMTVHGNKFQELLKKGKYSTFLGITEFLKNKK